MDAYLVVIVAVLAYTVLGAMLWQAYVRGQYMLRNTWEVPCMLLCGPICWVGFVVMFRRGRRPKGKES